MLISENIHSDIYFYVLEHLDEILLDSNNIIDVKNNIKFITYDYLLEQCLLESSSDVLDTVKTVFWSTTLPAWTGKILISNWITGIITSGVAGNLSIVTSALSQVILKVTDIFYKGASLTGAALLISNVQLLRFVSLLIFPTVLVGMVIYRLIKYSDIQLLKNFEFTLKSIIETLQFSNKSELFISFQELNNKYNDILANNCSKITDEESRLTCASQYYVKYITEDIMTEVIRQYIIYCKTHNINLSYVLTFYDLISLKFSGISLLSRRMYLLYDLYHKLLDSYVFDPVLKKRFISLLNDTTSKYIKELYL